MGTVSSTRCVQRAQAIRNLARVWDIFAKRKLWESHPNHSDARPPRPVARTRYLTGPCNRRPPPLPTIPDWIIIFTTCISDPKISLFNGNTSLLHPSNQCDRLIEHLYRRTPEVLALFESVPLQNPKAIRVTTYEYELQAPQLESHNFW